MLFFGVGNLVWFCYRVLDRPDMADRVDACIRETTPPPQPPVEIRSESQLMLSRRRRRSGCPQAICLDEEEKEEGVKRLSASERQYMLYDIHDRPSSSSSSMIDDVPEEVLDRASPDPHRVRGCGNS